MLLRCSNEVGAIDILKISWVLSDSKMGSVVCLDDIKLE
jgi:hypothetical protein